MTQRYAAFVAACVMSIAVIGCKVGPQYTKPSVPLAPSFKEATSEDGTTWKAVTQTTAQTLPEKWWEIFEDQQLSTLEEQLVLENQDLKIAEARLRQARAGIRFAHSSLEPTITTSPSVSNLRNSPNRPYYPPTLPARNGVGDYVLPFDLNYEIDLWGRVRRGVTAAREQAQASAADLQAATLSLRAELALYYFDLRSADAQKQLLDDTVIAYTRSLQLTQSRFAGGASPRSDVAQAQTQLDAVLVQDKDVTLQRAQYEHAIAVLLGKPPASFSLPAIRDARFTLPQVPVALPSELLEQRPDVAAQERRAAAANEQIGIAQAAYYPALSLSALIGLEATAPSNWFIWPSRFWAVGPQVSQTIFDGGRRRSISEQARANYDETVATYRKTTLTAFQEVEDNLAALRILDGEAEDQRRATAAANDALQLFTNRYRGGVDNYLQVITAQTTALQNERNDVDIRRRRMDATVLLVKATGGGWTTAQLPKY